MTRYLYGPYRRPRRGNDPMMIIVIIVGLSLPIAIKIISEAWEAPVEANAGDMKSAPDADSDSGALTHREAHHD